MAQLKFLLEKTDNRTKARAGTLFTDHGEIQTPIFMPVGTVGSVKAVTQQHLLSEINAQIILGNTYHLYLRPGVDILQAAGGLHRFNGWPRPILTDSGGYQVFSLSGRRKITEEGVMFQSHIDGSRHLFTPESVMDVERKIGADIIMAFDECPAYGSDYDYVRTSLDRTHGWLARCRNRFNETQPLYGYNQYLFGIVQGGTFADLRRASCQYVSSLDLDGNAIGGLSVGESTEELYTYTALSCENLPENKPRYLMGVGTPWNILEGIACGVDMFDCVMPARNGRNGMLFTSQGVINIKNRKWATDFSVIDPQLPCATSRYYSKAYLRHLFASSEILGLEIASIHNLSFYLYLVTEARKHILLGDFLPWKEDMIAILSRRL